MASLRDILGKDEYLYVSSALYGICGDDGAVSFVRTNGTTALAFTAGFHCSIDDSSGEILSPPELPSVTDAELADMTWDWMEASGELVKWSAAYQETDENGTLVERLSEVRLDDIFRVSDKAFVAWRLVRVPASPDGSHSRLVFWIDLPSGKIIAHHTEISEWLPIRSFQKQTDETSEQTIP